MQGRERENRDKGKEGNSIQHYTLASSPTTPTPYIRCHTYVKSSTPDNPLHHPRQLRLNLTANETNTDISSEHIGDRGIEKKGEAKTWKNLIPPCLPPWPRDNSFIKSVHIYHSHATYLLLGANIDKPSRLPHHTVCLLGTIIIHSSR